MVNLLLQENKINYSDVYIYSPTLQQPEYNNLKNQFKLMEKIIMNKRDQFVKIAHFRDTAEKQLIDPVELNKNQNHVMVFEDVMLEDQTAIKKYFCSGRHNNMNVFYLVQSSHKIAKHCKERTQSFSSCSSKTTKPCNTFTRLIYQMTWTSKN